MGQPSDRPGAGRNQIYMVKRDTRLNTHERVAIQNPAGPPLTDADSATKRTPFNIASRNVETES
jgi:hypothetical protein